jgi:hypothetical protein
MTKKLDYLDFFAYIYYGKTNNFEEDHNSYTMEERVEILEEDLDDMAKLPTIVRLILSAAFLLFFLALLDFERFSKH